MTTFTGRRLGLRPATPAAPRLRLGPRLQAGRVWAATPPRIDYLSRIPLADLPMYDNDTVGCCGPVSLAHAVTAAGWYGDGTPDVASTAEVLDLYAQVTGWTAQDPASDTGVIMQDMLTTAAKIGAPNRTPVLAFAQVDVADQAEVLAALHLFGHLLIGANLPISAARQTDARRAWTPTTGRDALPGSWGGHAMHVGAHSADSGSFTVTTWGQTQELSDAWWTRYVAECWIVITGEWFSANGFSPTGLDLHGLGEDFAKLTGRPNPFPETAPAVVEPSAWVGADEADAWFWGQVQGWAGSRRTGANRAAQGLVRQWAERKGLRQ